MSATGHSQFPASSAYRLLTCPGSYDLGQRCDTGARRSTVFSAEGTLAHSLSEAAIFSGTDPVDTIGRTFQADGFDFTPDEDFIEAVKVYVDFIHGLKALGFIVVLETRVSPMIHWGGLPDLGIDLFGTADCIAYHPTTGKLIIVDLKFGRGIAVEVQDNAQFLYYAAGALSLPLINFVRESHGYQPLPQGSMPTEIETIVVQPRAFHPDGPVRRATYSTQHVVQWARQTLYQGVETAINDGGKTLVPGEHCRFCPALAHCPATRQLTLDMAREAFKNAPAVNVPLSDANPDAVPTHAQVLAALPDAHISDQALGEMLDRIAILKPYIAALEALGEERIKAARPVPGWKVVPTRTRRVWADDDASIIAALHNAGVAPGIYTETRLRSPAQTERMIGKARYKQIVAPLVKQSTPGTMLAPEGDPRSRITEGRSAREAFGITN